MKRALLVLAATSLAVGGPSLATAANTTHSAAAKKKKAHAIKLTVSIVGVSPSGPHPFTGSQLYVGTVDGSIGGVPQHGAVRGTNVYNLTKFTGTNTTFGPTGSTKSKLVGTGTITPAGEQTFSGTGTILSGTGIYKGATGSFTFSGSETAGSPVATFTIKGTLKY